VNTPLLTLEILSALDTLSGGRLGRREDLASLLEATPGDRRALLDNLSFHAKFLVRARGIMERIGRDGEGYDRLASEFAASLAIVRDLLGRILEHSADGVRKELADRYLAMTPQALADLMVLCGDLRWYKNFLIDRGPSPGG
jgi:hypothetical protein